MSLFEWIVVIELGLIFIVLFHGIDKGVRTLFQFYQDTNDWLGKIERKIENIHLDMPRNFPSSDPPIE